MKTILLALLMSQTPISDIEQAAATLDAAAVEAALIAVADEFYRKAEDCFGDVSERRATYEQSIHCLRLHDMFRLLEGAGATTEDAPLEVQVLVARGLAMGYKARAVSATGNREMTLEAQ